MTSALPTATGVAAIMAGVFFFYRFEERWGRRLRSPSLVADASEFKVDFLVSAAVVVGLIGARLGLHLDHWVALLIALLVGKTGLVILRDAVRVLLDASLDFATLDRVRTIALDEPEVAAVKELHGRNSGSYKFIEMVVTLRVRQLEHAHEVSHRIEERVREEIAQVDSVLIHYEPLGKKTTTYAVPLLSDREHLSRHFGGAPLFGLITVKRGWLVREEILPNPFFDLEKGKGLKIGRWLLDQDVDAVFSLESIAQRGPGYLFRDVRLEIAPAETYQGVREQILEGAS